MRNIVLLLFFGFANLMMAQSLKTITHEEMWLMKRVGQPALSPDGKWVVYNVMEPSYNDKEQINDLWICATDGSESPRKLTALKSSESAYVWSPDGQYLAFTSKRDGEEESQIYLLPMKKAGEAQKLTSIASGASGPRWSPDSKKLLFTSSTYPMCYADSTYKKKVEEKKKEKFKVRTYDAFPIRNWDRWLDEKQNHLYIQHIDSISANNIFRTFELSKGSGFGLGSYTWAGDNEIVCTATADQNTGAYQDPDFNIYAFTLGNTQWQPLLHADSFSYSNLLLSNDKKHLYAMESKDQYTVYTLEKLVRFDYPSMRNKIYISSALDRQINNYEIDGDKILASAESEGRDRIYSLGVDNKYTQWSTGSIGCYTNVSKRSGITIASFESCVMPPEIVRMNADGSHSQLSHHNDMALSKLDLAYPETFYTKTSRGKSIRSLLVKPAHFESKKKYPLFVMMHGGPAISIKETWGYRWHPHVIAGDDFVLVITDYTGSTGYGEQFSQDIQYDPFRGPAIEINEAAAQAIKQYTFIDGSKQSAGGASYGGHLANWMQASTSHYKCLIAHAGLVNSVSQWGTSDYIWGREVMNGGAPWTDAKTWQEQNPMKYASSFKTPMLLTVGENDYRVPINNTIESFHIHQRLKIPSRLVVFPEENHWVLKAENSKIHYKEIREWLAKWLK